MISIEWIFFMQIALIVLIITLLRKMLQMKKQVDEIIKEVQTYVAFITEETEDEMNENVDKQIADRQNTSVKNLKQNQTGKEVDKDVAQTRLIQAVLGEYFP